MDAHRYAGGVHKGSTPVTLMSSWYVFMGNKERVVIMSSELTSHACWPLGWSGVTLGNAYGILWHRRPEDILTKNGERVPNSTTHLNARAFSWLCWSYKRLHGPLRNQKYPSWIVRIIMLAEGWSWNSLYNQGICKVTLSDIPTHQSPPMAMASPKTIDQKRHSKVHPTFGLICMLLWYTMGENICVNYSRESVGGIRKFTAHRWWHL